MPLHGSSGVSSNPSSSSHWPKGALVKQFNQKVEFRCTAPGGPLTCQRLQPSFDSSFCTKILLMQAPRFPFFPTSLSSDQCTPSGIPMLHLTHYVTTLSLCCLKRFPPSRIQPLFLHDARPFLSYWPLPYSARILRRPSAASSVLRLDRRLSDLSALRDTPQGIPHGAAFWPLPAHRPTCVQLLDFSSFPSSSVKWQRD